MFPSNKTELVGTIRLNNELQLGLWVPKEVDEIDDIDLLEEEMGKYNLHGLITYLEKVPLIEEWLGHLDIGEILVVDEENISDVYYLKDSILKLCTNHKLPKLNFNLKAFKISCNKCKYLLF